LQGGVEAEGASATGRDKAELMVAGDLRRLRRAKPGREIANVDALERGSGKVNIGREEDHLRSPVLDYCPQLVGRLIGHVRPSDVALLPFRVRGRCPNGSYAARVAERGGGSRRSPLKEGRRLEPHLGSPSSSAAQDPVAALMAALLPFAFANAVVAFGPGPTLRGEASD
jgi:hypothetical protein